MKPFFRRPRQALVMLVMCGAASGMPGCAGDPAPPAAVVASVGPVASLIEMVAGDRLVVRALLPPGRSPHDYEPSPAELAPLSRARLVVAVDDHVDGWMTRAARAAAPRGTPVLRWTELLDPGERDPHLWLDLEAVYRFLPGLAESLAVLDPEDADGYRRRAADAARELRDWEEQADRRLRDLREAPFALLHPAFAEFCRRRGLRLVAVLQTHPEGEALPRSLGEVTAKLKTAGAQVVFAEPQLGSRLAEAIAAEIGGSVAYLDPLGPVAGGGGYLDLWRWNVERLAEAL